jgi:isoquinoline 1-oxidoreductase alpha subunit
MGQFYGGPSVDAIPTFAGPLISTHGPTNDVTKLVAYSDVGYDLRTDHASYEPVAVSERRRIDTRTVSIEAPRTMCGVKASQGRTFMAKLNINGRIRDVQVEADTPLLWVIREQVGLTGTKYGCGVAQCGACSVHIKGALVRSCVTPVGSVRATDRIVTIEGLSATSSHPVQKAWAALEVPQCGYCQSGQIMAAVALLKKNPKPTDRDIDEAMSNICRCGTYQRIRAAVHMAAGRRA